MGNKDREYWQEAILERACIMYDAAYTCKANRGPGCRCKVGDAQGQDCQTCNLGVEGMTWEQAQKQATLSVGVEFERHKLAMKKGRHDG